MDGAQPIDSPRKRCALTFVQFADDATRSRIDAIPFVDTSADALFKS
jgi:hypothetical protein